MVASSADHTADPAALVSRLRSAGCVFAEEEAALLLAEASSAEQLEALVSRRVEGEPLEQVLGWAEFCGLRVAVAPGVFVPRRRTEALVALGAELARAVDHPVVVDLCCGTGAIGVAIAHAVRGIELHAADVDPAAVACARQNVTMGQVHEGDLYAALPGDLRGRVDVLAVNAPYVPTADLPLLPPEARFHEPHVALDGGADGLGLHRRTAAGAGEWLSSGGSLLIETGRHQAAGTAHACSDAGLVPEVVTGSESTVVRAISAARRSSGTMTG